MTFEEYAAAGKVVHIPPERVQNCTIIRQEDFQYSKGVMAGSGVFFSCWFTTEDGLIEDSDACVSMAEPSTGRFSFIEIKGVVIDPSKITGCRFQMRENGVIMADVEFKYYGLLRKPVRCVTVEDFATSRAYLQFRTRSDQAGDIEQSAAARNEVKSIVDLIGNISDGTGSDQRGTKR